MKPSFIRTDTTELVQVQQDVQDLADQLGEPTKGILLRDRAIAAAATMIAHGLRRAPLGWQVVSPQASATVWQTAAPDATYLYLQASGAVTAHIWVF